MEREAAMLTTSAAASEVSLYIHCKELGPSEFTLVLGASSTSAIPPPALNSLMSRCRKKLSDHWSIFDSDCIISLTSSAHYDVISRAMKCCHHGADLDLHDYLLAHTDA